MITALTIAIALTQQAPVPLVEPRLSSEDVYCAAIMVHVTENLMAENKPDGLPGMTVAIVYFLGRVQAAMPEGGASTAILDMAEVLDDRTIPPADLISCANFFIYQTTGFFEEAERRGRSLGEVGDVDRLIPPR